MDWRTSIRPGMHIEQWMIVPELLVESKSCPFPDCTGTLSTDSELLREPTWYAYVLVYVRKGLIIANEDIVQNADAQPPRKKPIKI